MRYISLSKRFINPDTLEPEGPEVGGFLLRPGDEGGMSVTEVEYFGDMSHESRIAAAIAHRSSTQSKKLGNKAIFTWARVSAIKMAGVSFSKTLRVVHSPVDGNPAHAEIRHFTDEDLEVLTHFATDVFTEWQSVGDMKLPPHS